MLSPLLVTKTFSSESKNVTLTSYTRIILASKKSVANTAAVFSLILIGPPSPGVVSCPLNEVIGTSIGILRA